jgi:sulfatase-like protein
MIDSRPRRFLLVLFPALLVPLQLLLFGPHTIYSGNVQEFSAPFWSLFVHLAPMILAIAGTLLLVGIVLPAQVFEYYVVGLVALGVTIWAQGNLMVGDYGVLNGQDIDWSGHEWRNRYELALWIAVPIVSVMFARQIFSTAIFASRILIALQIALLAYTAAQADPEARAKWEGAPEAIFELSSTQNVFHFVLDGFQSDAFHDILEAERTLIDRQYAGFTFFENHMGAFPTTIVSIPAMLTGSVYRNQEPIKRFTAREFKRASIFRAMRDQGYQVDAVSGLAYDRPSATNYYRLPTPYVTYDAYVRFAGWQLADLALFRHSPHVLKPWVYNDQSWRLQTWFGQSIDTTGRRYMPVNGQAFLADYTKRMHVGHDRPNYKYLHVGIPHWPVSVNADCEYIGARSLRRPNYTGQARCGISRVGAFLDKLRQLGLYDSSLIVISSDHGVALPPEGFKGDRDVFGGPLSELAGSALALLIVKPPRATGPVRTSEAPSAITDIPATIVDTLGLKNPFPGTSALKLDEHAPRPRQFAVYLWSSTEWQAEFFPYLDVFTVDGSATDGSVWTTEEPIYAPKTTPEGRSRGFYRPERGAPGQTFRWSSPRAFLHQPPDARGVELKVRSASDKPQTLTVEMRGQVIDKRVLDDHEWHALSYSIPPSKSTPAGGEWLVLRVDPPWKVRGDRRTFGVMTRDLKWIN